MATRLITQAGRKALYESLKKSCLEGTLPAGSMLPAVRELSEQHNITNHAVFQVIQRLTDEGILYTVPRVGAFVGRPQTATPEYYLYVEGSRTSGHARTVGETEIGMGFEEEIARRGGTTLILPLPQVVKQLEADALPPIAGVMNYVAKLDAREKNLLSQRNRNREVAHVNFGAFLNKGEKADRVYFDNVNGGRLATQHLIQAGHQQIAFLGVHTENDFLDYEWSAERLEGWRGALNDSGFTSDGLVFLPTKLVNRNQPEYPLLLQEAARRLLRGSAATAVVCANDVVALQLMNACREAGLPLAEWPDLVSFDDTLPFERNVLTSFRLTWDEIGRAAAGLLWERTHNRLIEESVSRLVPMRMIPRLSCRANWTLAESLQPVL